MASLALPEICGFVAESIRSSSRKNRIIVTAIVAIGVILTPIHLLSMLR